jgi:ferrous-iron efflux pump FieF
MPRMAFSMRGEPARLNRLVAIASISVALTLVVVKLITWLITGSIAILTSLVDSGIDLLASMITFISVRQAAQPPDRAHRYGHGKAEPLGAFAQAGFVGGSALILGSEAIQRLIWPQPISRGWLGVAVMVLAMALTAGLVLSQRAVVRRTGSVAIKADSLHYGSDFLMNLAVIAALVLIELTGWPAWDPLFAFGIVAVLLYSAAGVARHALDMLMDRELPAGQRAHIRELALGHPSAHGVHDLRTRRAGTDVFIELHLELDADLSLDQAHDITHEVEARIRKAFPDADIIVHQEPAGLEDERLDAQIAATEP